MATTAGRLNRPWLGKIPRKVWWGIAILALIAVAMVVVRFTVASNSDATTQTSISAPPAGGPAAQTTPAITLLNKEIDANPQNALLAYMNRGNYYLATGIATGDRSLVKKKAIPDLTTVIERWPLYGYGTPYLLRARAYTYVGLDEDAARDIEAAISLGTSRVIAERDIERMKSIR